MEFRLAEGHKNNDNKSIEAYRGKNVGDLEAANVVLLFRCQEIEKEPKNTLARNLGKVYVAIGSYETWNAGR